MRWNLPEPEFTWAGFTFPKWLWTLPEGAEKASGDYFTLYALPADLLRKRLDRFRNPVTGPYCHGPRPNSDDGQDGYELPMRWKYCDDVNQSIKHTGWFCDEHQDSKMRGVVIRLPRSRGFLVGWTMGEGMSSYVMSDVWDDELEAARAADKMAEDAAETEREYRCNESRRMVSEMEVEEETQAFDEAFGVKGACALLQSLQGVVEKAEELGIVLTITNQPIGYAMGSHHHAVTMRPVLNIIKERMRHEASEN